MKITFDIPDNTTCAFLNLIIGDGYMGTAQVYTDALHDGAVLVYNPEDAEHE